MLFVRRADDDEIHGPFASAEVRRRLKRGDIDESWLAIRAPSSSSPDDLQSQAWLPVYSVMALVPPRSTGGPTAQAKVSDPVSHRLRKESTGGMSRASGLQREQFIAQIRTTSPYGFLRVVNNIVFWLHCALIALVVLLCLFELGWSSSLGFWAFLLLFAVTLEAVVVVMVIRGGAEMAIDVADCIAEQARLAVETHQSVSPATPSPPPTPPTCCHKAPAPAHQQAPCRPTSSPRYLAPRGLPG